MARCTKEEAEKTREALLDAAEKVFFKCGVARTSLQEIAEEAGVTRGALYWHFKNKTDLVLAMDDRGTLPQEDLLNRMASGKAEASFDALRDSCLEAYKLLVSDERRRRVYTILTQRCEYTDEMAPIMQRRLECKARIQSSLIKVFTKARKRGELSDLWSPQIAGTMLAKIMTGLVFDDLDRDNPTPREGVACLTAFFRAARKEPAKKK